MPNPFMQVSGPQMQQNGPVNMIQAFNQFRQTFQGDPKAEVEKLLSAGKIDQNQLNQLQSTAQQFAKMMGMK